MIRINKNIIYIYIYTVDAAYKTQGYKVQWFIRIKIVWNASDVSKYFIKSLNKKHEFRKKKKNRKT